MHSLPRYNWTKAATLLAATTGFFAPAQSSQAQISLASRQSTLRYGYVHGGGPDVHSADVTTTRNTLLTADTMDAHVADSTAGEWVGLTWQTSVAADITQSYAATGPVNNASRIVSASSTNLTATAGGDLGLASMQCNNPGNELIFHFGALYAADYHLTGSITGGSSAFSYVALQRFNGFNWDSLFLSFAIPGTDITWDVTGTLETGFDYRLISALEDGVGSNQAHIKTLAYDFNAVPEPGTLVTVALGIAWVRRARVRKRT